MSPSLMDHWMAICKTAELINDKKHHDDNAYLIKLSTTHFELHCILSSQQCNVKSPRDLCPPASLGDKMNIVSLQSR